jgi:ParB-like chromosome segregation protein Spo0J
MVRSAFEPETVTLPIQEIMLLRQLSEIQRTATKYRRIASSIAECGIIEPPVVARAKDAPGRYILLDGHIRVAVLLEMGERSVRCLVSDDDEAFTYNKRVARLATIQEHFMIVRALGRGVSEEKLAKALNVDVTAIARRRTLLDGICPEVIDLVHPDRPKKIRGIAPEQMARMEREMESLQRDFKAVETSYGDDMLNLVIASGYLSKLISNQEISRYLETRHPELLDEFRVIISAASLDEAGGSP